MVGPGSRTHPLRLVLRPYLQFLPRPTVPSRLRRGWGGPVVTGDVPRDPTSPVLYWDVDSRDRFLPLPYLEARPGKDYIEVNVDKTRTLLSPLK